MCCIQALVDKMRSICAQELLEAWRKRSSMLLLSCTSAAEVQVVMDSTLKTLSTLAREQSGSASDMQRLKNIVLNHLSEISSSTLSETTGMSQWAISKLIRNACDCTVNEWLQQVRIEEAKRLLLETDMKVYAISEQVGYGSVDYFTGIFRKHVGTTPELYRKSR